MGPVRFRAVLPELHVRPCGRQLRRGRGAPSAFGAGGHDITITHPAFPGLVFSYTTFKAITADIDDARVYGGIHFRFDQDTGGRLGRAVADDVIEHKLLPLDGSQP